MKKTKITSSEFSKPMGAYTHAYSATTGDATFIYTLAQPAIDKEGNVVAPDDVAAQTEFVFESLQKILQEVGASLDDVIKATIFLTDMQDFATISPIRDKYFANATPASNLLAVKELCKPECKMQIEVIAVKEGGK